MKKTKTDSFSLSCFVALAFGILFASSAFCVALIFPPTDIPPVELVSPEKSEEEITPFFEDVGMLSLFDAEDEGLVLYRDASSRKAVEWFYMNVVGNKEIALAILEHADGNDIAPSLAFALAYVESRYKVDAKNVNKNKTVDRGLFQLNSASFPDLAEADFFDPAVSAKYGMAHLRFCLDAAGNEISALAMYNAGASKVRANNTPQVTLNYIDQIMICRETLNRLFADKVLSYYGVEMFAPGVQMAMAK